ncbi:hypothetical protein PAHAL_1G313400 [Panicum hallii]|uniref:Uncharacterized protein n=1 Tax=Panicum hallii TaxID=206008 RepID=A0A2S3GRH4_9POAL|nr:hypothetical protein PAHAL_1G313400 [Panicum hallii]
MYVRFCLCFDQQIFSSILLLVSRQRKTLPTLCMYIPLSLLFFFLRGRQDEHVYGFEFTRTKTNIILLVM